MEYTTNLIDNSGTCPNCGYCPHCKRSLAYPWTYPYSITWIGNGTLDVEPLSLVLGNTLKQSEQDKTDSLQQD